ncbi:MAG TPA: glutaredoxin 3 [Coxiellaceae bacterium]|nr:glutaredoxin 3 [Coxiellaceae bacterium]
MADVVIYTKPTCPYCIRAKALLDHKGVRYTEISIQGDDAKRQEMIEITGRHTVPQIIIKGEAIGGCDDLQALEAAGELDKKLH